jgi:hypothetical protein
MITICYKYKSSCIDGVKLSEKDEQMVKMNKTAQGKWRFPMVLKDVGIKMWNVVSNKFKEVDMKRFIIGLVLSSLLGTSLTSMVPELPDAPGVGTSSVTIAATRDFLADAVVLGSCFCLGGIDFLQGNAPKQRGGRLARLAKNQSQVNIGNLVKRLVGEMGAEQLVGAAQGALTGVGQQVKSQNPTSQVDIAMGMTNALLHTMTEDLQPFVGRAAGKLPKFSLNLAVDRVAIDALVTGMRSLWNTLSTDGAAAIPASQKDAARVTLLVIAMLAGYSNYGIDTVVSDDDALNIETVVEELGSSLGSGAVGIVLTKLKNMLVPAISRRSKKQDPGSRIRRKLGLFVEGINKNVVPIIFNGVKSFNDVLDVFALRGKLVSKSAIADLLARTEQVWLQISGRSTIAPASTTVKASGDMDEEEFNASEGDEEEIEEDDGMDPETRQFVKDRLAEKKKGKRNWKKLGLVRKAKPKTKGLSFFGRLSKIANDEGLSLKDPQDIAEAYKILRSELLQEGWDVSEDPRFAAKKDNLKKMSGWFTSKDAILLEACEMVDRAIGAGAYNYPTMDRVAAALVSLGYNPATAGDKMKKNALEYVDSHMTVSVIKGLANKAKGKSKKAKLAHIQSNTGIDYRYWAAQDTDVSQWLRKNLKIVEKNAVTDERAFDAIVKAKMIDEADRRGIALSQLLVEYGWDISKSEDKAVQEGIVIPYSFCDVSDMTTIDSWTLTITKNKAVKSAITMIRELRNSNILGDGSVYTHPTLLTPAERIQVLRAAGYSVEKGQRGEMLGLLRVAIDGAGFGPVKSRNEKERKRVAKERAKQQDSGGDGFATGVDFGAILPRMGTIWG